jgi:hypothetical protein
MPRIMIDGIAAQTVITAVRDHVSLDGIGATMGAGYRDGPVSSPQWTSAAWQALTAVGQPVVITVSSSPTAHVADVENGDMTPEQGAAWAKLDHSPGGLPVIYCNRSNKAAVEAACQPLVRGVGYGLWVATLDETFTDLDGSDLRTQQGVVAIQAWNSQVLGFPADASLVVDDSWLPVAPPPPVQPDAYITMALADLSVCQINLNSAKAHLITKS